MINVLTTLPHYAAVYPMRDSLEYTAIVLFASTLSVLYHMAPDLWFLMLLDHMGAGLWFCTDMVFASIHEETFSRVFFLNIFVFGAWIVLPADMHPAWHIISVIKCYCVATLLRDLKGAAKKRR